MFAFVGVISNTSVRTLRAGSTVVAPNGEINADMETRKMIQTFIRELKTEYGGAETVRCSGGACFSTSTSSVSDPSCFLSIDAECVRESVMVAGLLAHGRRFGRATYGESERCKRWSNSAWLESWGVGVL